MCWGELRRHLAYTDVVRGHPLTPHMGRSSYSVVVCFPNLGAKRGQDTNNRGDSCPTDFRVIVNYRKTTMNIDIMHSIGMFATFTTCSNRDEQWLKAIYSC